MRGDRAARLAFSGCLGVLMAGAVLGFFLLDLLAVGAGVSSPDVQITAGGLAGGGAVDQGQVRLHSCRAGHPLGVGKVRVHALDGQNLHFALSAGSLPGRLACLQSLNLPAPRGLLGR